MESDEFGIKAQQMLDQIIKEFDPRHALTFMAGATAQLIVRMVFQKQNDWSGF